MKQILIIIMLISTLAAFGQCGFVDFTTTNEQPCVDVNLCDFRFVDRGEDIENIDYRYSIVSNYETHNITFEDYEAFKVQHNSCCTIGGGGGGDIQFPECWKSCKMDVKIVDWGTPPNFFVNILNPVDSVSILNFPPFPAPPDTQNVSILSSCIEPVFTKICDTLNINDAAIISAINEIEFDFSNDTLKFSIIPEPCKPELIDCSTIYDYTEGGEGGNLWILLSKLPNLHPQAELYGNTFAYIGRTSNQSTHPTLPPVPQSVRGWNIFAMCAEEKPFTDSNQHDWLPGPVENYPTVDFFPNSEVFAYPECGSESQCLALQEVKYLQCDGSITYNYMIKSGGVLIPYEEITGDLLYECPQICCTSETKTKVESFGENRFWAYVQPDGTFSGRDVTVQKIGTGRYRVNLSEDCPTENYPIVTGVSESGINRDVPKVFVETGTQTINSFIIRTTIDDNGQAADIPRDSWFSFHIPKIRNISVIDSE